MCPTHTQHCSSHRQDNVLVHWNWFANFCTLAPDRIPTSGTWLQCIGCIPGECITIECISIEWTYITTEIIPTERIPSERIRSGGSTVRCWITSLGQLLIDPGKQIEPRLHDHPSQEGLNAEAWNSLVTTTYYELVVNTIMPRASFYKVAQCPKG